MLAMSSFLCLVCAAALAARSRARTTGISHCLDKLY